MCFLIFSPSSNYITIFFISSIVQNKSNSLLSLKFTICHAAADVLLWRNKRISSSILAGATAVWALLEWLNYHFLTLLCLSLVSGMLLQFVWSNAARTFKRYIFFLFVLYLFAFHKHYPITFGNSSTGTG